MQKINSMNPSTGKRIKGKRFQIYFFPNYYMIKVRLLGGHILLPKLKEYYTEFRATDTKCYPVVIKKILAEPGVTSVSYNQKENSILVSCATGNEWSQIIPSVLQILSRALPRDIDQGGHEDGYGLVCRAKSNPPSMAVLEALSQIGTVYTLKIIV